MVRKDIEIELPHGLHARPCGFIILKITDLKVEGTVSFEKTTADLKSILGLMGLSVKKGNVLTVKTEGPDETAAMQLVEDVLTGKYGTFI
jgi:phosphotransferase system HPr (HPr) family protein